MIIYTVRQGDTLYRIAGRYGVSVQSLQDDNMLPDPARLVPGQTIVIIKPQISYTTRAGDTLDSIARRFGVSLNTLWRNNPVLRGLDEITVGQELKIKLPLPTGGAVQVNGYAYPFIDRDVLRQTLPYLTYLSIFTYGYDESGTLIPIEDEEVISIAREYGVAPVLHLSSLNTEGKFSTAQVTRLLNDDAMQQTLIRSLIETLQQKGYVGVDVDFEYVGRQGADAYVRFVRRLQEALSPLGYFVWVALAPKVRADQEGVLYEGHPYRALGEAADAALLMTYEWGYTYGPAMAVSPLNQVRRVLDYAVTEIPPAKLLLGVPNYGYDWTLPYVAGESRARSLGNVEAVILARDRGADIMYDEVAQAPNFNYFLRGEDGVAREHEVWFEDARSMQAMLRLMPEYGLRGMAIWNIMRYFPQLYLVLNSEYDIMRATM
ncbi:MAG: LysM peptidoglycan-binding domain-containing protein [Clostridia bacterium]|nr:LysM peptidoglycan-binding domain-containing protein [Clostridia bacterium]